MKRKLLPVGWFAPVALSLAACGGGDDLTPNVTSSPTSTANDNGGGSSTSTATPEGNGGGEATKTPASNGPVVTTTRRPPALSCRTRA